jgi:hypothetical protein
LPKELQEWKPKERNWKSPGTTWRYEELCAALLWGKTPWQFDALPREEKSEMLAMMTAKAIVENFEYEAAQEAAERDSGKETQR